MTDTVGTPTEQFTTNRRENMSGTPTISTTSTTNSSSSTTAPAAAAASASSSSGGNIQNQSQGQQRAPLSEREHHHHPPSGGGGSSMREYCLRWNNHQPNLVNFFGTLLQRESFVDVTLVSSEGKQLHAHKLVLSACSPYFQRVFENNPCKHPVVILKDIHFSDLRTIISFVYNGEVNISQDRINSILATASTLQIKGLAEVPADELKRVGGPRGSQDVGSSNRSQPPPLQSSSPWASTEGDDFPQGEIPRKKLKKSASAAGPSMSTNGDNASASFESGVGASMSRSMDDATSLGVLEGSVRSPSSRPGPPPLTAGSHLAQQQKSRSLDINIERDAANIDSELSSGGFSENQTYDDSSLGADRGFELEIADVKIEAVSDDGEIEFDEESYDQHPDNPDFEMNQTYPNYPASSLLHQPDRHFGSSGGVTKSQASSSSRKRVRKEPMLDYKFQDALELVVNGRCSIMRAAKLCGIPKSTLYLRLKEMGISSVVPRVGGGKGRRGRLLIRQPRIKRLDNESGRNGGEVNLVEETSCGSEEVASNLTTNSQLSRSLSQQSRDEGGDENFSFSPSLFRQQSIVPIVTVSESSPTPPSSPSPSPQPPTIIKDISVSAIRYTSTSFTSSSGSVGGGSGSRLLMIPSSSSEPEVRGHSSSSNTLVKQLSQPHLPSQTSSSNVGLPRQHSQPTPSSVQQQPTRLVYSGVKPGDLFQIVPSEGFRGKVDERDRFLVDSSSILQVIPVGEGSSSSSRVTFTSKGSLKEMEIFKRDIKREGSTESNFTSQDSTQGDPLFIDESDPHSVAPPLRSGHCPVLRPGPALGCNYCWNSNDSTGRILRRKTKYHCPECHINLCIVPCFQEYHEKADKKKPKSTKLLPKPSSM